jgi:hypothetical protein|tara:strand:+ start:202 stop:537 length:336 start_codon:yes stop_codon:yes gene_type:complete
LESFKGCFFKETLFNSYCFYIGIIIKLTGGFMKEYPYLEGQDSIVEKIKNLPVFKPFNEEKLKSLLRLSKIRQYESQEIIIEEGTAESWIYFIISRYVQVEKQDKIISKLN